MATTIRMDRVMTPSSEDTLLCFVKRAAPERTKEKTGMVVTVLMICTVQLALGININQRSGSVMSKQGA